MAIADRKKGSGGKRGGTGRSARKRSETKISQLEALLRRPEGATVGQIMSTLGWQPHTIRAAISVGLRKSKGLTVTISKEASGERVYRIAN